MTLDEASKIVHIWGVYLEYLSRINFVIFGASAPESILPFPKSVIEEASNMIAEQHFKNGNKEAVNMIQAAAANLLAYKDDEEALLNAVKNWSDPKWREVFLPTLKESQVDWIKTQKIN